MSIYTLMPLHECLGLAVIGVDLGAPVDAETAENLRRLLAEHLVLVFPDQTLSARQYLGAAALFGPPMRTDRARRPMPDYPDIIVVGQDGDRPAAAAWHTADTGRERPAAATVLYAVDIPSTAGVTSIADMRAAYWLLPEDERRHLETLRTVNHPEDPGGGPDRQAGGPVVHPMVCTNPLSRERALYFQPARTAHIEGMSPEESRAYLDDLVERAIPPEIVYRHNWAARDVLVIDDRATLRRAESGGLGANRLLWRIAIEGNRPSLF